MLFCLSHQKEICLVWFTDIKISHYKSLTVINLEVLPAQLLNPSPENPVLQAHVKFPSVLMQVAFPWQLCIPA